MDSQAGPPPIPFDEPGRRLKPTMAMTTTAAAAIPARRMVVTWNLPRVRAPRGSLGLTLDPIGDDVDDPVGTLRRAIGEPEVEKAFDVAWLVHAGLPSLTTARASASRAARMARWALWSRERAVPGGMPRVSAISDGA